MSFSNGFVMSQNKMTMLVVLGTIGREWLAMIMFIKLKKEASLNPNEQTFCIHLNFPFVFLFGSLLKAFSASYNGSIPKTLRTTVTFYTTRQSLLIVNCDIIVDIIHLLKQ